MFGKPVQAYCVSATILRQPLILLRATVDITGGKGKTRHVGAAEFFRVPKTVDERETVLSANEVVTRISIPVRGSANATYEVRQRQGLDWPLVTASVAFPRAA